MEPPHAARFQVFRDAVRLLADMAIYAVDQTAITPQMAWNPLDRITECLEDSKADSRVIIRAMISKVAYLR
jgi:hypothetical protein